jgi:ubiquinone/menaquinone biosynthesis C-methylase UbiE
MSTPRNPEEIVDHVRARYGKIATGEQTGCGCGCQAAEALEALEQDVSRGVGYADDELAAVPEEANLGLGCGAPVAALAPRPGETVLDLGSGGGMDVFLAAPRVGPSGRVLGVDMTPEMIERARATAAKHGFANVEFRLGRLEALPVAAASVDAVTSNCVINLVPDKSAVFREVARVLRPGGRMVVSDIVLERPLPAAIADDLFAWAGCVAGAMQRDDYFASLTAAGLGEVEILRDVDFVATLSEKLPQEIEELLARTGVERDAIAGAVRSLTYRARRPA